MSIIGVVSMKGGVGKTSVTANLSTAMAASLGAGRVSVVDLDPQNALHWHMGVHELDGPGVCEQSLQDGDWQAAVRDSAFDVACLPYGDATELERADFEALLAENPDWVGMQLQRAGLDQDAVVIIDTPPGPSVYLRQVLACADLILVVLLADAGSYATVPAMETWLDALADERPGVQIFYVLNQVDRSEPLNRDAAAFLRQSLKPRMCPVDIHSDEAVGEALAFQQPVMSYEPHSQASLDVARMAAWTIDTLNR